jgi:hypothetical protein
MAQAATARWQALTAAVPIMSFKANGEWLRTPNKTSYLVWL